MGKPERNRSLGKPRHRVEHSVKLNSKEIEWEDEDKWQAVANVAEKPGLC